MTQLHTLTVRTTAALGRLADLQRRAEQVTSATPVIKPALKELTAALEELQVANEHLQAQLEELAAARLRADDVSRRFEEFLQVVPIACIWSDPQGVILEANDTAAALLNVTRARLAGKPLMLFLSDRPRFFGALAALSAPDGGVVETDITVRPRERRPRLVRLTGRVLASESRWCWFLRPVEGDDPPA